MTSVGCLSDYLAVLRAEKDVVPSFSPYDGGEFAECLFLLESPGPQVRVTGMVDRSNPDDSARNLTRENDEAGIPRERTISWNVVPWYVGGTPTDEQVREGISWLPSLLSCLPDLRVAVLLGQKAQTAESTIMEHRPELKIVSTYHPSPKNLGYVDRKDDFRASMNRVATVLDL